MVMKGREKGMVPAAYVEAAAPPPPPPPKTASSGGGGAAATAAAATSPRAPAMLRCRFDAETAAEMSAEAGEVVYITDESRVDEGWVEVARDGDGAARGLVPADYLARSELCEVLASFEAQDAAVEMSVSAGAEGSPSGASEASALPARSRERRLGSSERFSSSLMAPPPTEPRKSSDLSVARLSVPPRRTSESLVMYATRVKRGSAETGASSSMAVSVILARLPPAAVKCAAAFTVP